MWATGYREQKQIEMRIGGLDWHLIASSPPPPAGRGGGVRGRGARRLAGRSHRGLPHPLRRLHGVYAAVARLGGSFSAVAAILPAFRQAEPILAAAPGTGPAGEPPPEPSGDVRLDHVSFRYAEDGPLVLRDVSIHARAGEFVAVVGESGAGKSTLFRLALGLEAPPRAPSTTTGATSDASTRARCAGRIGMVAQDASLQPGTVLENIIGLSGDLTEEDAWRAARLAAVDEDVAAMPMRMQTVAGDGSPLFSGGQIQRILLAAALVRDPSVLFLDEATNWLDNRSQAQVMERLAELAVTRFVSAHRLSTIRLADSIHVLQDGRVAQTGTFDELAETEGPLPGTGPPPDGLIRPDDPAVSPPPGARESGAAVSPRTTARTRSGRRRRRPASRCSRRRRAWLQAFTSCCPPTSCCSRRRRACTPALRSRSTCGGR